MAAPGPASGDPRVVYLGNVDRKVSEDDIRVFAAAAGKVDKVAHLRNFAYVTFATPADASNAVARLNGQLLGTREVRAEMSKPATEKPAREPRAPAAAREPRAPRAPAASPGGTAEPPRYYEDRVVVRGLPREFDVNALKTAFGNVGTVTKARIGGGVGRLTFEKPEAAALAISLTGTVVEGHSIRVEKERVRRRGPRKAPGTAAGGEGAAPRARAPAPRRAAPAAAGGAGAAADERRAPREPRRVRVEALPEGTTPDQVKAAFARVGRIDAAKVIEGRNHGFVTFEDPAAAVKATETPVTVNGAAVTVSLDVRRPRTHREGAEGGEEAGAGRRRAAAPHVEREPRDLTHTVWAGGFDGDKADEASLRALFAPFGPITSVDIISRGRCAYVKYGSDASVAAAIAALNGTTPAIAGRDLKVEAATGESTRPARARGARRARGDAPAS